MQLALDANGQAAVGDFRYSTAAASAEMMKAGLEQQLHLFQKQLVSSASSIIPTPSPISSDTASGPASTSASPTDDSPTGAPKQKRKRSTNRTAEKGLDAFRNALVKHLEQHARLSPTPAGEGTNGAAADLVNGIGHLHALAASMPITPDGESVATSSTHPSSASSSSSTSTKASTVSASQRTAWLREYSDRISTFSIKSLVQESVKYRFPCSPYVILVPNWHALREALWEYLKSIGVKRAKRSVSTKKDLIEICIEEEVMFDFSPYVKDAEHHGNRKEGRGAGAGGPGDEQDGEELSATTAAPAARLSNGSSTPSSQKQPPKKRQRKSAASTPSIAAPTATTTTHTTTSSGRKVAKRRRYDEEDDEEDQQDEDEREESKEPDHHMEDDSDEEEAEKKPAQKRQYKQNDNSNNNKPQLQDVPNFMISAAFHPLMQNGNGNTNGKFASASTLPRLPVVSPSTSSSVPPSSMPLLSPHSSSSSPPLQIKSSTEVIHHFLNLPPQEYHAFKTWFYANVVQREYPGFNLNMMNGSSSGATTNGVMHQQHQSLNTPMSPSSSQQQPLASPMLHSLMHQPPQSQHHHPSSHARSLSNSMLGAAPGTPMMSGSTSLMTPLTPSNYPLIPNLAQTPHAQPMQTPLQQGQEGGANASSSTAAASAAVQQAQAQAAASAAAFHQWSNNVLLTPMMSPLTASTPSAGGVVVGVGASPRTGLTHNGGIAASSGFSPMFGNSHISAPDALLAHSNASSSSVSNSMTAHHKARLMSQLAKEKQKLERLRQKKDKKDGGDGDGMDGAEEDDEDEEEDDSSDDDDPPTAADLAAAKRSSLYQHHNTLLNGVNGVNPLLNNGSSGIGTPTLIASPLLPKGPSPLHMKRTLLNLSAFQSPYTTSTVTPTQSSASQLLASPSMLAASSSSPAVVGSAGVGSPILGSQSSPGLRAMYHPIYRPVSQQQQSLTSSSPSYTHSPLMSPQIGSMMSMDASATTPSSGALNFQSLGLPPTSPARHIPQHVAPTARLSTLPSLAK